MDALKIASFDVFTLTRFITDNTVILLIKSDIRVALFFN